MLNDESLEEYLLSRYEICYADALDRKICRICRNHLNTELFPDKVAVANYIMTGVCGVCFKEEIPSQYKEE